MCRGCCVLAAYCLWISQASNKCGGGCCRHLNFRGPKVCRKVVGRGAWGLVDKEPPLHVRAFCYWLYTPDTIISFIYSIFVLFILYCCLLECRYHLSVYFAPYVAWDNSPRFSPLPAFPAFPAFTPFGLLFPFHSG